MKNQILDAQIRTALGKNQVKQMKKTGIIPSVIYGLNKEIKSISIDPIALTKLFSRSEFGRNTVIELKIGDDTETVMPYQFDRDTFSQMFTHVDFLRVDEKTPIKVQVRIELEGVAPGTKMGGTLIKKLDRLNISCVPSLIPGKVFVDISTLKLEQGITVADLKLAEGIEVLSQSNDMIVRVAAPRGKSVEEEIEDQADADTAAAQAEAAAADATAALVG